MQKYIKWSCFLLLTIGGITCSGCSSNQEITIHSLKEGMQYLNTKKNYTLSYQANTNTSCYLLFEAKSIGFKMESDDTKQVHYIQDKKGIYPLTYDETYLAGEYLKDKANQKYQSLWDQSFYTTLYKTETEYVNALDPTIVELNITNKKYKMAFIKTLGYSETDYLNVEYVKCSFRDQKLQFELKTLNKTSVVYSLENLNTTVNQDVKSYLKEGGKVYTPNKELSTFRQLIRTNHFTRDIYDINNQTFVGCEIFHPHYFYSELYLYKTGNGAMELEQKANADHNFDLYGCYNFETKGSIQTEITDISFYQNPSYEVPDITLMYHYPTYLEMLDNLQYLKKGHIERSNYTPSGTSYVVSNSYYIYDFIYNFSFESTYDPTTCVPYGLEIDIDVQDDMSKSKITFVYYFIYQNLFYTVLVPLHDFNHSSIPLLDEMHARLNG